MLNSIAIDLQLYKIFKITRFSFYGTQGRIAGLPSGIDCMMIGSAISTQSWVWQTDRHPHDGKGHTKIVSHSKDGLHTNISNLPIDEW